jgi:mono/diheme cytochrome c family protein
VLAAAAVFGAGSAGCDMVMDKIDEIDMREQAQVKPYESSSFFSDRMSSRPLPAGTVPRGLPGQYTPYLGELSGGSAVPMYDAASDPSGPPQDVTAELLRRGRERFDIYCALCHNATGDGNGMIVQRGFVRPPSLHEQRLRDVPIGHFYDVMTRGYGAMFSYADRIPPADRWAIAAYVRALQVSQSPSAYGLPKHEAAPPTTRPAASNQHSQAPEGREATSRAQS